MPRTVYLETVLFVTELWYKKTSKQNIVKDNFPTTDVTTVLDRTISPQSLLVMPDCLRMSETVGCTNSLGVVFPRIHLAYQLTVPQTMTILPSVVYDLHRHQNVIFVPDFFWGRGFSDAFLKSDCCILHH